MHLVKLWRQYIFFTHSGQWLFSSTVCTSDKPISSSQFVRRYEQQPKKLLQSNSASLTFNDGMSQLLKGQYKAKKCHIKYINVLVLHTIDELTGFAEL